MPLDWDGISLDEFVTSAKELVGHAAKDMADKGSDHLVALVKKNTPVESFAKQIATYENSQYQRIEAPGHLRDSIEKSQLRTYEIGGDTVYEAGAETDVFYAPYVEEGTGLWGKNHREYIIRPKKPGGWLSWITQTGFTRKDGSRVEPGTRVFAKEVRHPGSPGQHMFAIGAELLEHEFEEFVGDPVAEDWARDVEGLA
jgi:hypothetical protein